MVSLSPTLRSRKPLDAAINRHYALDVKYSTEHEFYRFIANECVFASNMFMWHNPGTRTLVANFDAAYIIAQEIT